MRAIAIDGDIEEIGSGHRWSWENRDLAMVQVGRIVQPINLVAREFLEQSVLDHGARPAESFFGRLEDEMHGTVEVEGLGEVARGAEQHRGMAVMTAAVESAGNSRAPAQVGVLFHWKGGHVGRPADGLYARALCPEDA